MIKTKFYFSYRTKRIIRKKDVKNFSDNRIRPATYEEVQGFLIDEQEQKIGIRKMSNLNLKSNQNANNSHERRSPENSKRTRRKDRDDRRSEIRIP